MYAIRDRDATETLYDPETREDVVESTRSMIRKIEREVAEYLCAIHAHEDAADTPPPLDKAA